MKRKPVYVCYEASGKDINIFYSINISAIDIDQDRPGRR